MMKAIATFARAARKHLVTRGGLSSSLARDIVMAEIFARAFGRFVASDHAGADRESISRAAICSLLVAPPLFIDRGESRVLTAWGRESLINDLVDSVCREPLSLGWLFLFWNEQERDASTWAISRQQETPRLSSVETTATQLFTEEYMANFVAERCLSLLSQETKDRDEGSDRDRGDVEIFDPACGAGHLLIPALRVRALMRPGESISPMIEQLYGCDIDPHVVEVCRASMLLEVLRRGENNVTSLWRTICRNIRPVASPFGTLERRGCDDLLGRTYDCVMTNPPYIGRRKLNGETRSFLDAEYPDTAMDLCAAFVERCVELTRPGGALGLVTSDKWLRLKGYEPLRTGGQRFAGVYQALSLDVVCELGSRAFAPLSRLHDGMGAMLLTARRQEPITGHSFLFLTLAELNTFAEKSAIFSDTAAALSDARPVLQERVREVGSSVGFLSEGIIPEPMASKGRRLGAIAEVVVGLQTNDDRGLIRYVWSVPPDPKRWKIHSKGGGYGRWYGFNRYLLDWTYGRERFARESRSGLRVERWFEEEGWTYTWFAHGALGVRKKERGWSIGRAAASGIFCDDPRVIAFLNSRLASRIVRALGGKAQLPEGVTRRLPVPKSLEAIDKELVEAAVRVKREICSYDLTEVSFIPRATWDTTTEHLLSILLLLIEGELERQVLRACSISSTDEEALDAIFGVPVSWYEGASPELADRFWHVVPHHYRHLQGRIERVSSAVRKHNSVGGFLQSQPSARGTRPLGITMEVERMCRERGVHPCAFVDAAELRIRDKSGRFRDEMPEVVSKRVVQEVLSLLGHRWWSEGRSFHAGECQPLTVRSVIDEVLGRTPTEITTCIGSDAVARWIQGAMMPWVERRFFGEPPFAFSAGLGDNGGVLIHRWGDALRGVAANDCVGG